MDSPLRIARWVLCIGMITVAVISMMWVFWEDREYPDVIGGQQAIFLIMAMVLLPTQTPLLLARLLVAVAAYQGGSVRVGRVILVFSVIIVGLGVIQVSFWFLTVAGYIELRPPAIFVGFQCNLLQLGLLLPPFILWVRDSGWFDRPTRRGP